MLYYVILNNIIKHIYHYYICVGCTVPMDLCLGGYVCGGLYVGVYGFVCGFVCGCVCGCRFVWVYPFIHVYVYEYSIFIHFFGPNTYIPFMSEYFKQVYTLYVYSNYQYKVAHINTVNRNTFDTIYMVNYDITT